MKDRVDYLIDLLLDLDAEIEEQDDAAIDLGYYNDDRALATLEAAAKNPQTNDWCVLQTCGESAARIWVMRDFFNKAAFDSFQTSAKMGALFYIKGFKPEWIEQYNIQIDSDPD